MRARSRRRSPPPRPGHPPRQPARGRSRGGACDATAAAVASGVLFGLILLALLAAPLYASEIAGTGPADNHLTDRIEIDGRATDVVSLAGVPIGPTWRGSYFLGADENGRDLMVRVLYGARASLTVGAGAVAAVAPARDPARAARRLPPWAHGRGGHAPLRSPVVLPGPAARRAAEHRPQRARVSTSARFGSDRGRG